MIQPWLKLKYDTFLSQSSCFYSEFSNRTKHIKLNLAFLACVLSRSWPKRNLHNCHQERWIHSKMLTLMKTTVRSKHNTTFCILWFFKACGAGVYLGWVYVISLLYPASHVWFRVRVDIEGRDRKTKLSSPSPFLPINSCSPSWYSFLSLPSLPLLWKAKISAIIFT